MKKLLAAALLVSVWCCYDWLRPVEVVEAAYTVKAGDTWYSICDAHYMTNNAECFNEFWSRNMKQKQNLIPGDKLTISNRVYK